MDLPVGGARGCSLIIKGLKEFKATMKKLPQDARKEIFDVLKRSGNDFEQTAKRLAPVKSGKLKSDIESVVLGKGEHRLRGGRKKITVRDIAVAVWTGKNRYANFVEWGLDKTRKMLAEPFFWPAYRLIRRQVRRDIKNTFRRVLRKARKAAKQ